MNEVWKGVGLVAASVVILASGFVVGLRPALGQVEDHRVQICHKVQGNGNTGNGYNLITVDKNSIVNEDGSLNSTGNGHGDHLEDIIPPFAAGTSNGGWGAFPGRGDFSVIGSNCGATTTTTEPPTTTTTTETTTTTTTAPPTETTQPPTQTEPPPTTTTTAPPETQPPPTTETTETTSPDEPTKQPKPPPSSKPKPPPKNAPPGAPPTCPTGVPYQGRCGVPGNG